MNLYSINTKSLVHLLRRAKSDKILLWTFVPLRPGGKKRMPQRRQYTVKQKEY
jgi:hypothetical protein